MASMDRFVLSLADAGGAPVHVVGGKAAGFRPLAAAGLPFPDGIVVSAAAHRRARESGWAAGSPLPDAVAEAVEAALPALAEQPLAVRSSAVAEDGGMASFAGQFATLLGVRADAVPDAIAACWASAEDGRAHAYRLGDGGDRTMAVIVQALVDADVSGVIVTADPLTGDEGTLVVNASFGLGEAVVSGIVTPDEYRLARADGAVVDALVADKEVALRRGPDGTVEEELPPGRREAPALGTAELRALWRGALAAEAALGRPADLEFAIQDGRLLWLQCRPLTALPAKEVR